MIWAVIGGVLYAIVLLIDWIARTVVTARDMEGY